MELAGPRWKGKGFSKIALENPMSKMVEQLQRVLIHSEAHAVICESDALLAADAETADLLDRTCFGHPINTHQYEKRWFQLGLEEAFYLHHSLKCLRILSATNCPLTEEEFWNYSKSQRTRFPEFCRGYAHLRHKNWVVRPGAPYGVDFVAYRHHPALVHSEYATLIIPEGGGDGISYRLKEWSDLHGVLRVCGGVAKQLLVLSVDISDSTSSSCLEKCTIDERIIRRWIPKESREDCAKEDGTSRGMTDTTEGGYSSVD